MTAVPDRRSDFEGGFNFGPGPAGERNVVAMARRNSMQRLGTRDAAGSATAPIIRTKPTAASRHARKRARRSAGRRCSISTRRLAWTAQWYRAFADGEDMRSRRFDQIDAYLGQRVRLDLALYAQTSPRKAIMRTRRMSPADRSLRAQILDLVGRYHRVAHRPAAIRARPIAGARLRPRLRRARHADARRFGARLLADDRPLQRRNSRSSLRAASARSMR